MSAGKNKVRKEADRVGMELTKFDRFHQAVTMIDVEHRAVHDGMLWRINAFFQDFLANDESLVLFLDVPAGVFPHIRVINFHVSAAPDRWFFSEGVALPSPAGTLLVPHNANRVQGDSPGPGMSIYALDVAEAVGSPIETDGTLLTEQFVPSVGNKVGVIGDDPGEEWALKPATTYRLRFLNVSGGAGEDIHVQILWYELDYAQ